MLKSEIITCLTQEYRNQMQRLLSAYHGVKFQKRSVILITTKKNFVVNTMIPQTDHIQSSRELVPESRNSNRKILIQVSAAAI